ncbi:MAG: zinc ABC transporter substrate-binding protein [Clostridia bacterium]|nr:zinc ABC transporter substrate-binding protein [Clostridia bacterium]
MKKRVFIIIASFVILIAVIVFLITKFGSGLEKSNKMTIFTTIYPEYDFTKAIVGDKMEVVRLIGPGVEVHTYEPSAKDMMRIAKANAFIYTGLDMEPWAEKIIETIKEYPVEIVDTSKNIEMIESDAFMEEYSLLDEKHLEEHSHEDEEKDGHIWMNPENAIIMIDTILEEVVKLDPENREFYEENAKKYQEAILALDKEIEEALQENDISVLVFGGEFAYAYFCQRYNLGVVSCYTACGEHADPSIARIKDVIEYINENRIAHIYYEELSEGQISQMISEETKTEAEVFNTLHNVTQEEIGKGENYISMMRENLKKIVN